MQVLREPDAESGAAPSGHGEECRRESGTSSLRGVGHECGGVKRDTGGVEHLDAGGSCCPVAKPQRRAGEKCERQPQDARVESALNRDAGDHGRHEMGEGIAAEHPGALPRRVAQGLRVLDDVECGGVQPDEREECDHPAGWDRRLEVRVFGPRCGSEGKSVGRQRADHHGHGRHDRLVRRTRIEDRRQVAERVGGARADPGPESEPSSPEDAPKPADQNHGEPPQAQAHGQRGDHHQEPCLREEGEHGGHAAGSEAVRHGPGVALKAETPSRQQAPSHATDAECAEEPAQPPLGQRQRQLHQREFREEEEIDVRRRDRDDGARHRRPAR